MPLMNISLWDNYKHAIEALSGGRNTVVFDDLNLPSVMVRIPAFSVEDIDADLGTGSHPAFLVNTTQKAEIMVAMYNSYVYGTRAYSLPYKDPTRTLDFDAALNDCLRKNQGDTTRRAGWHMYTNWEAAAVALLCIKNGQPTGSTDYGRSHASKQQTAVRADGLLPGVQTGIPRILTGTGPAAWRHDGTNFGISDLVGNIWEWVDGMKLSAGKFYLPTDNYYTLDEASWPTDNVILADDTGAKLGVSGTDSLYANGLVDYGNWKGLPRTAAYAALSAAIKNRYQQALVDPAFDSVNPAGALWFDTTTERMSFRSTRWDFSTTSGIAALFLYETRAFTSTGLGFRLAYIG